MLKLNLFALKEERMDFSMQTWRFLHVFSLNPVIEKDGGKSDNLRHNDNDREYPVPFFGRTPYLVSVLVQLVKFWFTCR